MAKARLRQLVTNGKKWTIKQLAKMVQNGTIQIAKRIQRGYGAWDGKQKSRLILSSTLHRPIPNLYARRVEIVDENGNKKFIYYIVDGQHRLLTMVGFINDEFPLVDFPAIEIFDECENEWVLYDNLNGKKFSELPSELQDEILNNGLTITYMENLTDEEEDEIFINLNNGKQLNTQTKTFAYATDKECLVRLADHNMFKEMYTERARKDHKAESWLIKAHMMLNYPLSDINFKADTINEYARNLTIENEDEMVEIIDYMNEVYNILVDDKKKKLAKKMVKDTHSLSLVPFFNKANKKGIDTFKFAEFIVHFFDIEGETSIREEYNLASSNAGGSNANIVKRYEEIMDEFYAMFDNETITNEETTETTTTSDEVVVEEKEDNIETFIENLPVNSEVKIVDNYGTIIGYDTYIENNVLYITSSGDEIAINIEDIVSYEVA